MFSFPRSSFHLATLATCILAIGCTTGKPCECEPQNALATNGGLIDVIDESPTTEVSEATEKPGEAEIENASHDQVFSEDLQGDNTISEQSAMVDSDANDLPEENTPKLEVFHPAENEMIESAASQDQASEILEESDGVGSPPLAKTNLYKVAVSYLNVRSGPSMQYGAARVLGEGEIVQGLGREGIWVMIGENEYVSISFLEALSTANQSH